LSDDLWDSFPPRTTLPSELSENQTALLWEIAKPFTESGEWPTWDYVQRVMRRRGFDARQARQLLASLPRVGAQGAIGTSYGFTARGGSTPSERDRVELTVAAALPVAELRPIVAEPFLLVLHHMIALQRSAVPLPGEVTEVWLDSKELAQAIPGLRPQFIDSLPEVLSGEPCTWGGGGSGPNPQLGDLSWRRGVRPEVEEYAEATTLELYVAKVCEIVAAEAEESSQSYPVNFAPGQAHSTPSDVLPFPDHGRTFSVPKDGPVPREETAARVEPGPFIEPSLIEDLKEAGAKIPWAMDKLTDFCRGLNSAVAEENPHVAIPLVRMIMDHVPPGFGCTSFAQVAEHESWSKTDKGYMTALRSSRLLGDDVIHRQLRRSDSRITMTEVRPMKTWINALLQGLLEAFYKATAARS
jgi:hypothetical protein